MNRVALVASVTLWAAACTSGAGSPCDTDSDCDKNLICVLAPDATPDKGGTCEENVADLSYPFDSAKGQDMNVDLFDAAPDLRVLVQDLADAD